MKSHPQLADAFEAVLRGEGGEGIFKLSVETSAGTRDRYPIPH